MATSPSKSIAVLGAGITGLVAAWRLSQRGHRVRLFEATARIGGAIHTERVGEWLVEAGPNSILADPRIVSLIDELGLSSEQVAANPAARNRFIVRGGKPLAAPLSPPALLRSRLFSTGAKLRLVAEMLQRPRQRPRDVSLEEFIRDHFGQELVDYGLNPFVSGVYAGNPRQLSARHAFPKLWAAEQTHGSLLRAQIAAAKSARGERRAGILSFRNGLHTLPEAIAAQLPPGTLALETRAASLRRDVAGRWRVDAARADGATDESGPFDAVVAALPAPALVGLSVGERNERPLASLSAIEHPPVSSLFLGFRRADVGHPLDGFGLLVPEVERRTILGVLFSSTLFPGRAPEGHVALTVLVGGMRAPEIARRSADELWATVEPDLRELLAVRAAPVLRRHQFWPLAIPQYTLGYENHLETMSAVERAHPGLWLGGQARDGISLPACIAAGERLARQID